ncbi:hypothetical protein ACSHWO_00580 [Streptomyces sp. HUAS TT3]|uniref:hypothetical protein n=1 Tax=Streptomyces sp. HUAS TT3 TaxID=3447510 RepID=UPI003F65958A
MTAAGGAHAPSARDGISAQEPAEDLRERHHEDRRQDGVLRSLDPDGERACSSCEAAAVVTEEAGPQIHLAMRDRGRDGVGSARPAV